MINSTLVKEFLLLGFEIHQYIRVLLFIFILFMYIITVFSNLIIIGIIGTNQTLRSPMFIFLCNLSVSDIMFTTNVVPNLLAIIPEGRRTISFNGCVTQLFFHGLLGSSECHTRIMDVMLLRLIFLVWISSFIFIFLPVVLFLQLNFCGPNVVDHFFCDLSPLLALSCSNTFIITVAALVFSIYVMFLSFFLIISSYVRILLAILRIPSTNGRKKTFSTCSAHLFVVCTYLLSIISVYSNPSNVSSSNITKLQSLVYIVVPPLFNPIIYAMRNKEIQSALQKLKSSKKLKNLVTS